MDISNNIYVSLANLVLKPLDISIENYINGGLANIRIKMIIDEANKRLKQIINDYIDRMEDIDVFFISSSFTNFYEYRVSKIFADIVNCNLNSLSHEKRIRAAIEDMYLEFKQYDAYILSQAAHLLYSLYNKIVMFQLDLIKRLSNKSNNYEMAFFNDRLLTCIELLQNPKENFFIEELREIKSLIQAQDKKVNPVLSSSNIDIEKISRKSTLRFQSEFNDLLAFESKNGKKLKDVFVWPNYKDNLGRVCYDLFSFMKTFIYTETKLPILLILGWGGIGKSSLLKHIAYLLCCEKSYFEHTLFIKFSEIVNIKTNLIEDLNNNLQITLYELRNSLIVLDAYDEFEYVTNSYYTDEYLLSFLSTMTNKLNNKVIITSREGHIDINKIYSAYVFKLLPFNKEKREEWLKKYNVNYEITTYHEKYSYGNELMGIPFILYMTTFYNIDLSVYYDRYALYQKLFGNNGLWVKRLYEHAHNAHIVSYKDIAYEYILDIAIYIFNANTRDYSINMYDALYIMTNTKYNVLVEKDIKYLCGIIMHYQEKDIVQIQFIHKSIFEFLLAKKLATIIWSSIKSNQIDSSLYDNIVSNRITKDISYFMLHEFRSKIQHDATVSAKNTTQTFINVIMTDMYTIPLIMEDRDSFSMFIMNILTITETLHQIGLLNRQVFLHVLRSKMIYLLHLANFDNYTFTNIDFSELDLSHTAIRNVTFLRCQFDNTKLCYSNLSSSTFIDCSFNNTNFYRAILSKTSFKNIDLSNSFLRDITIFSGVSLTSHYVNVKLSYKSISEFVPNILIYNPFHICIGQRLASKDEVKKLLYDIGKIYDDVSEPVDSWL